jgi:hypothetical protein
VSWVKLDDAFFSNRKVRAVSVQASHLAIAGLCFCAQNENDGHLLDDDVKLIANMAKVGPVAKLVEELVGVGIWEREKGGFAVHDFLEYNPSHAELEQKRVTTKKRVSAYRNRTCNGVGNGVTTSVGNGSSNGVGNTTPLPLLSLGSSPSLPASDQSNGHAKSAHDWYEFFKARWWEVKGRQYGQGTADAKGEGRLHEVLEGLLADDRAADWDARERMVGEFLSKADQRTIDAGWSFSFFVSVFNGLRIPPEQRPRVRRPGQPEEAKYR